MTKGQWLEWNGCKSLVIVVVCLVTASTLLSSSRAQAITVSVVDDCTCSTPGDMGSRQPAWSPDGQYLAIAGGNAFPPLYLYWGYIAVIPMGASATDCYVGAHFGIEYPSWAPDSRRFVFAEVGASGGLFIQDCDATSLPTLLLRGELATNPSWSPDGSTIAYSNSNVWLVSASGGSPWQLTTQGGGSPSWSPDGKRIAYQAAGAIWIISSTGGEPRRLTDGTDPAWSPDGGWIAFASNRAGNSDIWVIATTGGTAVRITSSPEEESDPTWAPDQRSLAFTAIALSGDCSCVQIATDLPVDWTTPVKSQDWSHVKLFYR